MKRILSLILACLMALTMLPAMAEASYDEHMSFTATFREFGTVLGTDEVYDYFCDMFNMDVEMNPIPGAAFAEKNSMMINGGTMTDWMQTSLPYAELMAYAEAGMLKPLPDGWEERWPNLAQMVEKSGIADKIKVDGKTYSLPKAIFCNYVDGAALTHHSLYYRKDWAEELGFNFGDTITISELKQYALAAIEKDMAGNGQTIGLTAQNNMLQSMLLNLSNTQYKDFMRTEEGYVWGPTQETTLKGIEFAREMYESGAIDEDYYLRQKADCVNLFASGACAALYSDGTVGDYELLLGDAAAAGMENPKDKIAIAVLTDDEGVWHGMQADNYSWETVFSPELSDEKMERALDMMDFSASEAGQEIINMGLKNVDWKINENGEYEMITEGDIKNKYSSIYFWWLISILPDEFSLISPARDAFVRERVNTMYSIRSASNSYTPIDFDLRYFSSEAKNNFSVDVQAEIDRLIVEEGLTSEKIAEQWNAFIDSNKGLWQPVVEDLNAALLG